MVALCASIFSLLKVTSLTLIVLLAFVFSSLGWRHIVSDETTRIVVGAVILLSIYVLMIFELVNRTLAALIGAAVSVAAYDCLLERVDMQQILAWQDLETLALLFGMMIIVSILSSSGVFDYLAVVAYKCTNGHFWALTCAMSLLVALLSAVLDNVSTMLLISPTLIRLSELERIDPRYLLMIMVIFSNIGGCATPVGDPPNLIIINDKLVSSPSHLGISFSAFVAYGAPCVLVTLAVLLLYLKLRYKSKESFRMGQEEEEDDDGSRGSNFGVLEDGGARDKRTPATTRRRSSRLSECELEHLVASARSNINKTILIQSLGVLVATVLLFFAQSLPETRLTLGWISLFGALTLLVMSSSSGNLPKKSDALEERNGQEIQESVQDDEGEEDDVTMDNFERVIQSIEWSTLVFFFSLFIVMEVMSKLGLIKFVGTQIIALIDLLPEGSVRAIGAITIVLWSSGFASALIDNVPFTSMMIKVLGTMAEHEYTRLPPSSVTLAIKPLVFALAFGACYGGNGTLIGASANLVTAGMAARRNYPISFGGFFRFCAPATFISLAVANVYLVLVFVFLKL